METPPQLLRKQNDSRPLFAIGIGIGIGIAIENQAAKADTDSDQTSLLFSCVTGCAEGA